MNLYATKEDVKRVLGHGDVAVDLDAVWLQAIGWASRRIDTFCERKFNTYLDTKYFKSGQDSSCFDISDDVLSVTSLDMDVVGDWTHTENWVEGTEYILEPDNTWPKMGIWVHPSGSYTFPIERERYIKLQGEFGYGNGTQSPWGAILGESSTLADADVTALTIVDGGDVLSGQTLKIEDEQLYVSAASGDTATIVRGVNGTIAAGHAAIVPFKALYPEEIIRATVALAIEYKNTMPRRGIGTELSGPSQTSFSKDRELGQAEKRLLYPYKSWWGYV